MKSPLFSFAMLALLTFASTAAAESEAERPAGDVASGGAAAPQAPSCDIRSAARTWKIPVNTGVPISILESSGAKLTPSVKITPDAEYTFLADIGSPRPEASRLLKITNAKAGDIYDVVLNGTCEGGRAPLSDVVIKIEYIAEVTAPTVLGTMAEAPKGTTVLTLDPSYLPFQQVSTIEFTADGTAIGTYAAGTAPTAQDTFGVRACIAGACAPRPGPGIPVASAQLLDFSPSRVCTKGRDSGIIELKLAAQARIPGATTQPVAATGTLQVDCSKATDDELGKVAVPTSTTVTSGSESGCSVGHAGRTGGFAGFGLAGLALGAALLRRRTVASKTA